MAKSVFGHAQPKAVVVTTPNAEYNALYPLLPADSYRHSDHRFEWNRSEFEEWTAATGATYGYSVEHRNVGHVDERRGSPTQMAIFSGA